MLVAELDRYVAVAGSLVAVSWLWLWLDRWWLDRGLLAAGAGAVTGSLVAGAGGWRWLRLDYSSRPKSKFRSWCLQPAAVDQVAVAVVDMIA